MIVGREIYEHIINSRRQQKYKKDEANKQKANEKAKEGMKELRQSRTPDEIKHHLQIRKTYEVQRKMTREQASIIIQCQYRKNKEAKSIVSHILNDIIDTSFNEKIVDGELKSKEADARTGR